MNATMSEMTVVIVPGLRDHAAAHWQTLLEARLRSAGRNVRVVPPMGRADLDCVMKVAAIQRVMQDVDGPVVVVAHSGGCIMLAHWARWATRPVHAALLATPPDFEMPMPDGYPTLPELAANGWLPVPRMRLPFPSIVAASRNDPLGSYERVSALAAGWGSTLLDLGEVGHLNPASGYGAWPQGLALVEAMLAGDDVAAPAAVQG